MIRTIKDHLEAKTGINLKMEHPVFEWLMNWAAAVINRYIVDADGRTPYYNIKGRNSRRPIAAFGERVLYMPLKLSNKKPAKLDTKKREGIWLGLRWRSDEHLVGTKDGVVKARTVRRLLDDQKWNPEMINQIRGAPRRPTPEWRAMQCQSTRKMPKEIDARKMLTCPTSRRWRWRTRRRRSKTRRPPTRPRR